MQGAQLIQVIVQPVDDIPCVGEKLELGLVHQAKFSSKLM
jgi:hypothetical protein